MKRLSRRKILCGAGGIAMALPLLGRGVDARLTGDERPEIVASFAFDVSTLPEDIAYTARGVTVVEELELWDMPAAFLVLLTLLAAEWAVRRRRGLA